MVDATLPRESRSFRRCLALLFALVARGAAGESTAAAVSDTAVSCVGLKARPAQAIGAIRLDLGALPTWLRPPAERAAAFWNDPGCNRAGEFPKIVLDETPEPHRVIRVRWEPGHNPREPRSCGSFIGAEIILYGRAIDPRVHALGGCGDLDRVAETLAHELGHALGLTDRFEPACYGSIMSQLVWTSATGILPRRVQPYECAAADLAFETPAERRAGARRDIVLASAGLAIAAGEGEGAAALARLTLPEPAAEPRRRSARTAPGILGTASAEFHP